MSTPEPSLFARILGPAFERLPTGLRDVHDARPRRRFQGRCAVERGRGALAIVLAIATRLPASNADCPLSVTIEARPGGEIWTRHFAQHRMQSRLSMRDGRLDERIGLTTLTFDLEARDDGIAWVLRGARALFVPLPLAWFAGTTASEYIADGRYWFDVRACMRGVGVLIQYRGWLEAAPADRFLP